MKPNRTTLKFVYTVISIVLVLIIWKALTLHLSPLVVPTISSVAHYLLVIFTSSELYEMIFITISRLTIGLAIGVALGFSMGILMGHFKVFEGILSPIIGIFQTIPPVSWVVLALVWFGFNGKPAIFMVTTSAFPIIAISVYQGIVNIDPKLLQMAQLYRFSKLKRFKHVIIPSVACYFIQDFELH